MVLLTTALRTAVLVKASACLSQATALRASLALCANVAGASSSAASVRCWAACVAVLSILEQLPKCSISAALTDLREKLICLTGRSGCLGLYLPHAQALQDQEQHEDNQRRLRLCHGVPTQPLHGQ